MTKKENYDQLFFESQFILESNKIENIEIPFSQIWRELETYPKSGHTGALVSANLMANKHMQVTEKMICDWQKLIIQEQNSLCVPSDKIVVSRYLGHYRDCEVYVGHKSCMPSQAVPICMKHLIDEINYFQKFVRAKKFGIKTIVEKIADFHFEFLFIHPFVDGNGRTSRILAWYLFKYLGLKPFIFTSKDKHETYYKAFDGMREYFLSKYRQSPV